MPWQKLLDRLDAAKNSLLNITADDIEKDELRWAQQIPTLAKRWRETNPKIMRVILDFGNTGQWPQLTREEILFIRWRLEWAYRAVEFLKYVENTLATSTPDLEEKVLFEYILCQAWVASGEHSTASDLSVLFRGYRAGTPRRNGDNYAAS